VQALPSLHAVPSTWVGFEQTPLAESQVPGLWHWSAATQTTGFDPVHVPDWQLSVWVQTSPSSQTVPFGWKTSGGQLAEVPVHSSSASQGERAARHNVPALPGGCWHATFVPSHWSVVQTLPSSVQTVPAAFLASGQVGELPVQLSARSHSPAAARQAVDGEANPSAGQASEVPLQVSATSQAPAAARQTVPLATGVQVPTWPVSLHAPHPPSHAESQQTPLTQKPLAH
jgi:hypothetical protein